jgi:hypothetical protein
MRSQFFAHTRHQERNEIVMTARKRLLLLGAAVLALNVVVLTPIAVLANLPTQFGGAGTDAGEEFLSRGTAISAPLAPLLALGVLLPLLHRSDRWAMVGIVGTGLIGIVFLTGALGEVFSDATPEVSKVVLLASGAGVGALAAGMVGLAIAAGLELRRATDATPTARR